MLFLDYLAEELHTFLGIISKTLIDEKTWKKVTMEDQNKKRLYVNVKKKRLN